MLCRLTPRSTLTDTRFPYSTLFRSGLGRPRPVIGRGPAPGSGAVAAGDHALPIDVAQNVAVAGEQRARRADLGAKRQLALGDPVSAVLLVLGLGIVFQIGRANV